jgi:hypothetical protein
MVHDQQGFGSRTKSTFDCRLDLDPGGVKRAKMTEKTQSKKAM